MMLRNALVVLLSSLAILVVGCGGSFHDSRAVTFLAVGHVTQVEDSSGKLLSRVSVGDPMTITYTFDKTKATVNPPPQNGGIYSYDFFGQPNTAAGQVGKSRFFVDSTTNGANMVFNIAVAHRDPYNYDRYVLTSQDRGGSNLNIPNQWTQVSIYLEDDSMNANYSYALPLTPPDASKFTSQNYMTLYTTDRGTPGADTRVVVYGKVDRIELVR